MRKGSLFTLNSIMVYEHPLHTFMGQVRWQRLFSSVSFVHTPLFTSTHALEIGLQAKKGKNMR